MKKELFCEDWKFRKEGGAETIVTLPHDAMLTEQRSPEGGTGSGGAYFPGGVYLYEKEFTAQAGEHVEFLFEGVYRNAKVWINGQEAGGAAYGYTTFTAENDGALVDGVNTITVRADNSKVPNSRWYSGAGIYRPVWMLTGGPVRIASRGIRVTTLSVTPSKVRVDAAVTGGSARVELLDGDQVIAAGEPGEFTLPEAKLWSDETPKLYRCRVKLYDGAEIVDTDETTFGIRLLSWNREGLFVNGKSVLLRGGCIHHDNGILGAACVKEAEWRKVRILKQAGFNAIRSAHNPASEELLSACDFYGVYVMDETWDMWFNRKTTYDYAADFYEHYRDDLREMVQKDYNHPSVIFYSIGNEVGEPASEEGLKLTGELVRQLHELDSSRAVTGGFNLMIMMMAAKGRALYKDGENPADRKQSPFSSTMFNLMASKMGGLMNQAANSAKTDQAVSPALDLLDIAGYNYASGRYAKDGKLHPDRVIFGSETLPQDITKNWKLVKEYPYLIGDFMWTAWDYLGEVGIGAWSWEADAKTFTKPYPWLIGGAGAFDINGDPTGEVFQAGAAWETLQKPEIAVRPVNHGGKQPAKSVWRGTNSIPSWSFRDCEGETATVEVYANAASVTLSLNGRSGTKPVRDGCAVFRVHYAPGTLKTVAKDADGRKIGESSLTSAGPAEIRILPEKETVQPGEVLFLDVVMADARGNIEANDDRQVTLSVEGGELLGFGSSRPRTEENFRDGVYTTWYGRALAAVRAGKEGSVTVTDGHTSVTVPVRKD